MSERKYEHAVDMDLLVDLAVRHEQLRDLGFSFIDAEDYRSALAAAVSAIAVLQEQVWLLLTPELTEELQDALDEALKETADA